jgi:hypothetical protein
VLVESVTDRALLQLGTRKGIRRILQATEATRELRSGRKIRQKRSREQVKLLSFPPWRSCRPSRQRLLHPIER